MRQYFEQQLEQNPEFDEAALQDFLTRRVDNFKEQGQSEENVENLTKALSTYITTKLGQKQLFYMVRRNKTERELNEDDKTSFIIEVSKCFEDELEIMMSPLEYLDSDPVKGIPMFRVVNEDLFYKIIGV